MANMPNTPVYSEQDLAEITSLRAQVRALDPTPPFALQNPAAIAAFGEDMQVCLEVTFDIHTILLTSEVSAKKFLATSPVFVSMVEQSIATGDVETVSGHGWPMARIHLARDDGGLYDVDWDTAVQAWINEPPDADYEMRDYVDPYCCIWRAIEDCTFYDVNGAMNMISLYYIGRKYQIVGLCEWAIVRIWKDCKGFWADAKGVATVLRQIISGLGTHDPLYLYLAGLAADLMLPPKTFLEPGPCRRHSGPCSRDYNSYVALVRDSTCHIWKVILATGNRQFTLDVIRLATEKARARMQQETQPSA